MNDSRKPPKSKRLDQTGPLGWVKLGEIHVSDVAQRRFNQAKCDSIVASFDLSMIGYPVVNHRESGEYYVVDGQHRVAAIKEWLGDGCEEQSIECRVFEGLSEKEEARLFDVLNDTLTVTSFDKFKVRVVAGYPLETHVYGIVESEGMHISRTRDEGCVHAVGTLCKVYGRDGPDVLRKVIQILRDAYGTPGFEAKVLDGIGLLCARYGEQIDSIGAVEKLGDMRGGVKGLVNQAEVIYQQTGQAKAQCIAAAAVAVLNRGVKGKARLANWWAL